MRYHILVMFIFLLLLIHFKTSPLSALEIRTSGGMLTGNFDTTLSVGAAWRVESRDADLIGVSHGGRRSHVNGDDGNSNYDTGFISQLAKVTHEVDLNCKNFGLFVRGNYFYDFYNQNKDGLSRHARSLVGRDARLLDAYIKGDFDIKDRLLNVRLGSQVLSWGESTFIQNGINCINTVNLSKLRSPGSELREALIPTPMISASFDITENINIKGFYLFTYDHIELDPVGTYFSIADFIGPGGETIWFGPEGTPGAGLPREDRRANDSGQFGVALRLFVPAFNDTEFGLFYVNYHSRLPIISIRTGTQEGVNRSDYTGSSRYIVEYPEDIHLFGFSFNTLLGNSGIALQGEFSFRNNAPLQIDDNELVAALFTPLNSSSTQLGTYGFNEVIDGYKPHKVGQAQATASRLFGPDNPFRATNIFVMGEAGFTHVYDLEDKSRIKFDGPESSTADAFSWGYHVITQMDYANAVGAATVSPKFAFSHDVGGITPGPISNFIQGRKALNAGAIVAYLDRWRAELSYTRYFGIEHLNLVHDRDFIAFDLKYFF